MFEDNYVRWKSTKDIMTANKMDSNSNISRKIKTKRIQSNKQQRKEIDVPICVPKQRNLGHINECQSLYNTQVIRTRNFKKKRKKKKRKENLVVASSCPKIMDTNFLDHQT